MASPVNHRSRVENFEYASGRTFAFSSWGLMCTATAGTAFALFKRGNVSSGAYKMWYISRRLTTATMMSSGVVNVTAGYLIQNHPEKYRTHS